MPAYLTLASLRDVNDDFMRLKATLPDRIVAAADVFQPVAYDPPLDAPLIIARVEELEDTDFDEIKAALTSLGITDMEITRQVPFAEAESDPGDPSPSAEFFGVSEDELSEIDAKVTDLRDRLMKILNAEKTGIAFPEDVYKGKKKDAYDEVIRLLNGRVPKEDKGTYLWPSDITDLRKERPKHIPKDDWDPVIDHLSDEVRYFRLSDDWFGNNGHFQAVIDQNRVFNYNFVQNVNADYLHMDPSTVMRLGMDVGMGLATRAIGAVPSYGPWAAAMLSAIWTITKTALPDPNGVLKAAIDQFEARIFELFAKTSKQIETANTHLAEDWGLLDMFGRLIKDEKVTWPRDLTAMRTGFNRAFHYEVLRTGLTLTFAHDSNAWYGIVFEQHKAKTEHKRYWHPERGNYHLSTHSKHYSGRCASGEYYKEFYLGYRYMVVQTGNIIVKEASKNLQAKLFGVDTKNETNPQFGLSAGFLLHEKDKERASWSLKPIPG